MKTNKSNKNRKMPNTAYYVIVVAIMVIINFFLLPRLAQEKVVEQTYDQFISESEEKKIEKVMIVYFVKFSTIHLMISIQYYRHQNGSR